MPCVLGRLHQGAQCGRVSLAERNDLFSVVNPWRATLPPTEQREVFASRMLRGEQLLLLILLGFLVWHEGRREHSRSLAYRECAAQICWPALPSLNECHLFYQQNCVEEEERFREGELEMKRCFCPLQAFCHQICWPCTFNLKRIIAVHGDSGLCVSYLNVSPVWE